MSNYNKDEYGQTIYVDMGEDVSTATSTTIILEPKIGAKVETTTGVSVGSSNITIGDKTYLANKYLTYTVLDGDLDYAGLWRKKGKAVLSSTNIAVGDYESFTVLE